MQGDTGNAHAVYSAFFGLWKDVDCDIPILKQAQAEYAKLESQELELQDVTRERYKIGRNETQSRATPELAQSPSA
jgi:hypothetical protein